MRTVSPWTIAACLAALALVALAADNEEKVAKQLKEISKCCATSGKLLSIFNFEGFVCKGKHIWDKIVASYKKLSDASTPAPKLEDGCIMHCVFESYKLLNKDDTIDEQKLRAKFSKDTKKLAPDVVRAVTGGVDECLSVAKKLAPLDEEVVKLENVNRPCKLQPHIFMSCITTHVLFNCPRSDWPTGNKGIECDKKLAQLKITLKYWNNEAERNAAAV